MGATLAVMKLTKRALQEILTPVLAKHNANQKAWDSALEQWRAEYLERWQKNHTDKWRNLRDRLTKALRAGEPITVEMVNQAMGVRSSYWSEYTYTPRVEPTSEIRLNNGAVFKRPNTERVADLQALSLFLESTDDEEFTVSALERFGFKGLAWLFRAAAATEGSGS
ncbi:hypothetical protein SEA_BLACKBEETLE_3 [Mycobacterium phage Blackbeetle]|uniref:Uncharacterized protein n=3 Tax=Marvinvirus mosmoris TaxID=1982093 RepID=A0A3S9U8W8_9CAUD|nr:hypothetical protein SEA_RAELA_2 [Mycobacterium phage Raela]QBQ71293.1 hypothetical protein SEA_BLACKBEETLE_3 [Mycobacterium phage Blackbeetle]QFP94329.1 hypothetical protein SEA_POISE_3 [Mycobacterium phage Poise]